MVKNGINEESLLNGKIGKKTVCHCSELAINKSARCKEFKCYKIIYYSHSLRWIKK